MAESHLGIVESIFDCGPECPTCKAVITPEVAMNEHAPLCAALAAVKAENERLQEQVFQGARRERYLENLRLTQVADFQAERDRMREALSAAIGRILRRDRQLTKIKERARERGCWVAIRDLFTSPGALTPPQSEKPDAHQCVMLRRREFPADVVVYECEVCGRRTEPQAAKGAE